jgi:3',5'-cyclic AMP phosphodiesterase CpdA
MHIGTIYRRRMRLALLADCHISTPNGPGDEEHHPQGLELFDKALAEAERLGCERVVIAGDLVNMGYAEEYAAVAGALEPWAGRVDVVPGNHEVARAGLDRFAEHFGEVPRRATYGGVRAVLLNSAVPGLDGKYWMGKLDDASRHLLLTALAEPGPLIVVVHHPFSGTIRPAPYPMMSQILDDAELGQIRARQHPTLVITGHTHRPDLRREGQATFLGCPPMCFWPHAFLTADVGDGHVKIETHRLIDDPADSPDPKVTEGERGRTGEEYRQDCEPPVPELTLRLR